MKFRAHWYAGYGCIGSILLSGKFANSEDALMHARYIIGPHVMYVTAVKREGES